MPLFFILLFLIATNSYSQPIVNLGKDTVICDGDSYTMDAGNPGSTYKWSTEETTQKIKIYQSGTYFVNIVDSNGQKASDEVEVVFLYSQFRQTNNWVMGNGGQISFKGTPDSVASTVSFPAGASVISGPDGQLQFYTNGGVIYDKNGGIMQNGDNIAGDPDYGSNSIIIPKPGSSISYFVFTLYPDIGLYYSEVNIGANNGLGEVINKNILVDEYAGALTAVGASDDVNTWLIVQNKNSNVFYCLEIDRAKVDAPVISQTGPVVGTPNQIKVSPGGDKIAVTDGVNVHIYKFSNDKGKVEYIQSIPVDGAYGVDFSRGNNNLFVSTGSKGGIFQIDISPLTETSAAVQIYQATEPSFYGDLQLGINGNVYVANDGKQCLPEIKDANSTPVVIPQGMCLMDGATSNKDLPPFPQNYFKYPPGLGLRWGDTCEKFSEIVSAQFFLDKYPFAKVSYQIDLGDGTVVDTNYTVHAWQEPGTYTIKLTVNSVCPAIIREAPIYVDSIPPYTPMRDTVVCRGASVILNPQTDSIYSQVWSNGETGKTTTVTETGNYSVIIKGVRCDAKDTAHVTVNEYPQPNLKDWDWICLDKHESLTIESQEGTSFKWFPTDDSTKSITVNSLGNYKVIATVEGNCSTSDSIEIVDLCEAELYPPDVFTPNNDKVNDIYLPLGKYLMSYELRIYNRWGELIFVSKDPTIGWDGNYRGKESEGGAYGYVIIYESVERNKPNSVHNLNGNLILLK